jgi:hypothetical protein
MASSNGGRVRPADKRGGEGGVNNGELIFTPCGG